MFRAAGWLAARLRMGAALFAVLGMAAVMPERVAAQELCHYALTDQSDHRTHAEMLSSVQYAYAVTHDEACRLEVVPDDRDGIECERPQIDMRPVPENKLVESRVTLKCQYRRPGYFYSAPVHFELTEPVNGHRQAFYVARRVFQVTPSSDEASLEARLTFHVWANRVNPWPWLIFGASAVGMGVLGMFCLRRRKQVVPDDGVPELEPLEEFWLEMRVLSEIEPTTDSEMRAYHDRLSVALRRLISRDFDVACLCDTTRELFLRMKHLGLPPAICMETRRILELADLVKFAGDIPERSSNLMLLRDTGYLAARLDVLSRMRQDDSADAMPSGNVQPGDVPQQEASGDAPDGKAHIVSADAHGVSDPGVSDLGVPLDDAQMKRVAALLMPSSEHGENAGH